MKSEWTSEVLQYWFEELTSADWFEVRPAVDQAIRQRFTRLHQRMSQAIPAETFLEPQAALAGAIVFDQFPRNIFRGTAEAFATDRLALAIARNALESGFDAEFSEQRRQFLYMPFMHSEMLVDQERCVGLFQTLSGDGLRYAIEHRDIIAQFSRFPHRNRALARKSTPEEEAFLARHPGYGQ